MWILWRSSHPEMGLYVIDPWIWMNLWWLQPIEYGRSYTLRLWKLDHNGHVACTFFARILSISGSPGATMLEKPAAPKDHPSWAQPFDHPVKVQAFEEWRLQMIPSHAWPFESFQLTSQPSWSRQAISSVPHLNSLPPESVRMLRRSWLCY